MRAESLEQRRLLALDVVDVVKLTAGFELTGDDGVFGTADDGIFTLDEFDQMGSSLTAADLDQDGRNELLIGLPERDEVRILSFNANGTPRNVVTLADGVSGIPSSTIESGDQFGASIAIVQNDSLGTILAIGAPQADTGGEVFILEIDASVLSNLVVNQIEPLSLAASPSGFSVPAFSRFGSALTVGDADNDGSDEIYVGAPETEIGGVVTGAVFQFDFDTDPFVIVNSFRISDQSGEGLDGFTIESSDLVGQSLSIFATQSSPPNFELVIGAPGDDGTNNIDSGAAYFLNLDTGAARKVADPQPVDLARFAAASSSSPSLPDLDGNGISDVLFGIPGASVGSEMPGAISLVNLVSPTEITSQQIDVSDGELTGLTAEGNQFGSAVEILGDINGDGNLEIAVGSIFDDTDTTGLNRSDLGAIYLLSVTPVDPELVVDALSLSTSETGTSDSFSVSLSFRPNEDVTVSVVSDDTSEVDVDVSSLVFTPTNWDIAQTVTVTGVDDSFVDGEQIVDVILTVIDPLTSPFGSASEFVTVFNEDDDVSPSVGNITGTVFRDDDFNGVVGVDEPGISGVTVFIDSNNDQILNPTETSTLTDANGLYQFLNVETGLVTVSQIPIDGFFPTSQSIQTTVVDSGVSVVDFPNLPNGFSITSDSILSVDEAGTQIETISITLDTMPQSDVVITLSPSDATEVAIDLPSLLFTPSNWDISQSVTIRGVADQVVDGDVLSGVTVAIDDLASDDGYDDVADETLSVTTTDSTVPAFTISADPNLTVSEDGLLTETVSVLLDAQPLSDVQVDITPLDSTEVSVSAPPLTFTAMNWGQPQVVTLAGVDDSVVDGDITSQVVFQVNITESDSLWTNVDSQSINVVNLDDDFISGMGDITGVVYRDDNNDLSRGTDESGLSGVTVYVDSNDDGDRDSGEPFDITDSNGQFFIVDVPDGGTVTIRQEPLSGFLPTGGPLNVFVDSAGVSGLELSNLPLATLAGSVFEDADGDGSFGTGEFAEADFALGLFAISGAVSTFLESQSTDSAGSYIFENVLPVGLTVSTESGSIVTPDRYEIRSLIDTLEQTVPRSGMFGDAELIATGTTLPFNFSSATPTQEAQVDTWFNTGLVNPSLGWGTGVLSGELVAADFDGDGDDDVAVANELSDPTNTLTTISVFRNIGGSLVSWQEILIGEALPRLTSITADDVNGDGRPDVVFTSLGRREVEGFATGELSTGNYVAALLNRGTTLSGSWNGFELRPELIAAGVSDDLDANFENASQVSRDSDDPVTLNNFNPDRIDGPMGVATGDVLGNGTTQVLTINAFSNNLSVISPNLGGTPVIGNLDVESDRLAEVTIGNIDGDGIDDVALASVDGFVDVLLSSRSTGTSTGQFRFGFTELRDSESRTRSVVDVEVSRVLGTGQSEIVALTWPNRRLDLDPFDSSDDDFFGRLDVISVTDNSLVGGPNEIDLVTVEQITLGERPIAVATGDLNRSL
ncbi:MAG: SdrD B-like domain-containing protein, partial [Planctomycetota bacterium]